jgi:phage tail-like protein
MAVDLGPGRQTSLAPAQKSTFLFSAVFRLWTVEGSADFAELGGIVSEIEQTEYMEAGPIGALFSRHAGRSKPPSIVLRRAMRTDVSTSWLWLWHQAARQSLPSMHRDCTLTFFGPGDDVNGPGRTAYQLMNAWPAKVELGGVKAGGTEVIVQTVTLQCDELLDMSVG